MSVEDGLKLSINELIGRFISREYFDKQQPYQGVLVWNRGDRQIASIGYMLTWHRQTPILQLEYTITPSSGQPVPQSYIIQLISTACNYGGVRWWFQCPRCQRRIGCIYKPGNAYRFACRQCHDLRYTSSQEAHQYDRKGGPLGALFQELDTLTRMQPVIDKIRRGQRLTKREQRKLDAWIAVRPINDC
ncbi:MAG: hypothetical protein K8L97_33530 [Anaerolineae bacterium]|nr:hypothetical protein [Anaerolineae bacterium]